MPYINHDKRKRLDSLYFAGRCRIHDAGELNYCLTRVVNDYLNGKGLRYATINEIVGALECAKQELYRRIAVPYEDDKQVQNGDVYDQVARDYQPRDTERD